MKKLFLILLVCVSTIGYSQNEKLVSYINSYEGYEGLGNIPNSIFLNSTNLCDWVGENMYKYDLKKYTSLVNSFSIPDGEKWDESIYIEYQLQQLDDLLNKYYTILKFQSNPDEFQKIKSNQILWVEYRDNNRNPITINTGYIPSSHRIFNFEIELYELRINELCYYMSINCNNPFWSGSKEKSIIILDIEDIYIPGKELGYVDEDHVHFSILDNKPVSGLVRNEVKNELGQKKISELHLYNGVYQAVKSYVDGILDEKVLYQKEYDGFPHNKIGWDKYLSNGKLKEEIRYGRYEEGRYWEGEVSTRNLTWYQNGQLKSEINYTDGYKDGVQKNYYENGQLKSEEYYDKTLGCQYDGNLILIYNYKGKLIRSYEPKVGVWKYYSKDGHTHLIQLYHKGELLSEHCLDDMMEMVKCE